MKKHLNIPSLPIEQAKLQFKIFNLRNQLKLPPFELNKYNLRTSKSPDTILRPLVLMCFVCLCHQLHEREQQNLWLMPGIKDLLNLCFIPHPLLQNHQKIFIINCFDAD